MEEIVGQAIWTTTNHTKDQSSSKEGECCVYIWWDWKVVLYYELLPENQTINSNKYCSQLDQMKAALDEKRLELVNKKCIIFHQDNARPHVSLMTRQKLLQLAWKFWFIHGMHQTLHLCISISFSLYKILLKRKNFNSLEDCKRHLEQFFTQKDKKFWKDGIMKLPEKWQKTVEQTSEYVVQ